MVDVDAEYLYVKQLIRCYEIIAQQRQQIQQLQELLSKGKKETKSDGVGKSKLPNRNTR